MSIYYELGRWHIVGEFFYPGQRIKILKDGSLAIYEGRRRIEHFPVPA